MPAKLCGYQLLNPFETNALANYLKSLPTPQDNYLRAILTREAIPTGLASPLLTVQNTVYPIIQAWGNVYLLGIKPSGSFAKGTANKSGTDIDLFISLSESTPETLSEVYNKLDRRLQELGYITRRQDVSINIKVFGQSVDLVPAKRQNALSTDHSLYRRKADTWTKTNVDLHANYVGKSGRLEEIRILKLWRDQHRLDWPSFYLELTVIQALGTTLLGAEPFGTLADNVWTVFKYLRDKFVDASVSDPGNWSNTVSNDLTRAEKALIRNKAVEALAASDWNQIVR